MGTRQHRVKLAQTDYNVSLAYIYRDYIIFR